MNSLLIQLVLGVSGAHGIFTPEVLQNMAKVNENKKAPIIMPLSNPTSKSECTAEEAHTYAPVIYIYSISLMFVSKNIKI